jgi:hypothetical protein
MMHNVSTGIPVLIPLVTAECFGITGLGKLLAVIIMGYSIGQWMGPPIRR